MFFDFEGTLGGLVAEFVCGVAKVVSRVEKFDITVKKVWNVSKDRVNMFKSLIKIDIFSEFIFNLFCLTICLLENNQKK